MIVVVSSFLRCSPRGGGGRLLAGSGDNHGGRGGYSSPRVDLLVKFLQLRLRLRRGRLPHVTSPLSIFAAKLSFEFNGLSDWAILLLGLCYLFLGLTPVHSPPSTRLKEAKW
ncbi:hypothetical protein QL285_076560 [Trifolium repens]|nr:hypothetical protein QL285_076560 [Trifolium repens]